MSRIVDLTLPFGPDTLSPPSVGIPLKLTHHHRGPGFWQASTVEMLLHTGSHVDFLRHCAADGETAADVPLDRSCGPAVVLDVTSVDGKRPVTVDDVQRAVGKLDRPLQQGEIALVHTGWSDRWWDQFPAYYMDGPWCDPDAARWLMGHGLRAVGFDCFSEHAARLADFGSEDFLIHKIVLEAGGILMQQMTNLGALPPGERVNFFATFPKMREAEGVPARFFAILDEE